MPKTGVYVCSCGTNISETVDVEQLAREAAGMDGVADAETYGLLCSEQGKEFLEKKIRDNGLDRVVVAACSPRQHEATFQKVCTAAGLNPFLMQMANIRELCSWVTPDPALATEKASHLMRAAIQRVKFHGPLAPPDVDCNPDAIVVGGGAAGIEAALLLASKGRKVTIVEKSPCIGGMVTRYEDVYPTMECATCMIEPKMDAALHSDNIEILTLAELEDVKGFMGNFNVRIRRKARYIEESACFGCNVCLEPCPVKVDNEYNEGMNTRGAIYIPYAGALPSLPAIDRDNCLRFKGKECTICADACGFGAVNFEQRDEIVERDAGAVVLATGFGLFDCSSLPALGYGKLDNVVTTLELERLISTTGHTEGKVTLKNGETPKRVAFIHCVGGRDKDTNNYCSAVCCMNNMKLGKQLVKKLGGVDVQLLYTDLCIPGENGQEFFDSAMDAGIKFTKINSLKSVRVDAKHGGLAVKYEDAGGAKKSVEVDLVALAPAMVPGRDTAQLAKMFSIDLDKGGFFTDMHGLMSPVATRLNGVFVAGSCQGPAGIRDSALQGKAAAGEALSALVPGEKLTLEAITTWINGDVCSGCRICNSLCPYKAIGFDDEEKISVVNEALCRGCGTCAAACPSGAAVSRHFDKAQMFAEISGVLS